MVSPSDLLTSQAVAEVTSGTLAASSFTPALAAILTQIESGKGLSPDQILGQVSAASPAVAAFVATLQSAVTVAKEGTTQGLFLSQQLQQGAITLAQFKSAVEAITLTPLQLQSSVATTANAATLQLVATLAADSQLNSLPPILSKAYPKAPDVLTADASTATPKTPDATPNVDSSAFPKAPDALKKKETAAEFKEPDVLVPVRSLAKQALPETLPQPTSDQNQAILGFFASLFDTAIKAAETNLKASASALVSLTAQPRIVTGARAIVRINGQVAALCTGVSYEISAAWDEIKGIDELLPNELIPTAFTVRGQMGLYRVPGESPIGKYLMQDMFRGIIWPYTTIEIRDKRTDEVLVYLTRCAITSQGENYRKGELTVTNLSFVSIGFRDETIPAQLSDPLKGSSTSDGLLSNAKNLVNSIVPDTF